MTMTEEPRASAVPRMPDVREIGFADLKSALKDGLADFLAEPLYGLFFAAIFVAGGFIVLGLLIALDMPWMILPFGVGFPLLGPFVAAGLYEVSRCRARGERPGWRRVLTTVSRQRQRQMSWMAFVILFIFWIWIYQVRLLLALFLGFKSFSSLADFFSVVTTTPEGLGFLLVGSAVGAFLALVLFSSTVIAMPLLLDRELDFVSAMIVSFKTVRKNPRPMLAWGVIVGALTLLALAPAFLGLFIVLPVLGHATWHLFEKVVGSRMGGPATT
ncbi:putative membrane protein [Rhodopseudomonas julia]|uniref:Membrane protein n=2 Tax=Rhodopseudomonas julia TaxID=200617 RepID=A0ABU0C8P4_9BRAD|nr:putative membrane protein [Rhodopseudomonas julia]